MVETFALLDEEHLVFLGIVITLMSACASLVLSVVAVQLRKLRQSDLELRFRDELLRRGLSVDEAERIISCRQPGWSQRLEAQLLDAGARVRRGYERLRSREENAPAGPTLFNRAGVWMLGALDRLHARMQRPLSTAASRAADVVRWISAKSDELSRRLAAW